MKFSYKINESVTIGKVEDVKSAVEDLKDNEWETENKISTAVRYFIKKLNASMTELFSADITGYDDGLVVSAFAQFLYDKTYKEGFIRVIFELELGSDDPNAIVKVFEEKC